MKLDNQSSFWKRFLSWKREAWIQYSKVCSKRNGFVNVVLAIALSIATVISLTVLGGALTLLFKVMNGDAIAIGITWTFYTLFLIYHMTGFLVGNRKKDILPAFIGSTFVWSAILAFHNIISMPNTDVYDGYDRFWSELIFLVIPFAEALLVNAVYFGLIRAVMAIRKEGITTWSLVQDDVDGRSKFEKASIAIACILWILPAIVALLPYF